MMKYLLGLIIVGFAATASAADINNGKKWKDMTDAEKQASMDRLRAYNRVFEFKALREGGYKDISEYNRVWNPTFDQSLEDAYAKWRKLNPVRSPYKHNAWLGER